MQSQFKASPTKSQIYSHDGRVIGAVSAGVFHKSIKGSRHILRTPPALCCDDTALSKAEALGAVEIRIRDSESGKVYSAPLQSFREHGFTLDRQFGRQVALSLSWWTVRDANGRTLQAAPVERVTVEQMALPLAGVTA